MNILNKGLLFFVPNFLYLPISCFKLKFLDGEGVVNLDLHSCVSTTGQTQVLIDLADPVQ